MMSNRPMEEGNDRGYQEVVLDELFTAYRDALPDRDAGPNFTPEMWALIEAREVSTNWFGKMAKALVTAAIAASVILGVLLSSMNQSAPFFNGTFVQALVADHIATLEPLHLDRISEIEMERQ